MADVISRGGILVVSSAIVSSTRVGDGTSFSGAGALLQIDPGGSAVGSIVNQGEVFLSAGGTATGSVLSVGGTEAVFGGTTTGTFVSSGGDIVIQTGSAVSATVASGGSLNIGSTVTPANSSAVAISTHILPGAIATLSGGTAVGTVVSSGAILSGPIGFGGTGLLFGITSATDVLSGGLITVEFGSSVNDTIEAGASATFSTGESVSGARISGSALFYLATGRGVQVFSGGTVSVTDGSTLSATTVASGATLSISGATVGTQLAGGTETVLLSGTATRATISAGGLQAITSGGTTSAATVLAGGVQRVGSGGLASGAVVSSGGTQILATSAVASGTTLLLGAQTDLTALLFAPGGTVSVGATDVLSVSNLLGSFGETLSGSYTGERFVVSPDAGTGTLLTAVPCYCPGTLIRTASGDIPVEHLTIGDPMITLDGSAQPIQWIGRRSYAGRFVDGRRDILPVRLHAGALGAGLPRRDLLVSPLHAIFLDGVLVPASALVNGVSVTQAESVAAVHYVHIELHRHAVIFAEDATAESFVDDDSRGMFHNAHEYAARFPGHTRVPAAYCAPRVQDGEMVERVKRVIDIRAGLAVPGIGQPLRGHLDSWDGAALRGWAQNPLSPEAPIGLEALLDGVPVARVLANLFRADLRDAGLGSGRHGFRVALPVNAGPIEVRRLLDGAVLGRLPAAGEKSPDLVVTGARAGRPS